jgi:hypothetical protein
VVRHPLTKALYLFEGGTLCKFLASDPCNPSLSTEAPGFLVRGSLDMTLAIANQKVEQLQK